MSNPDLQERSEIVKQLAGDSGFDLCGISAVEYMAREAPLLEKWLRLKRHGEMHYMERNSEMRLDPGKLVPGARSVISLIHNYYPERDIFQHKKYRISKYAYGKDYHRVLRKKLKKLFSMLREKFGEINGRVFVDSAPVMERQWAARAGIGWLGKNTLLLNKTMGSFFFLAEIISDLELHPDIPVKDFCGSCTKCIDACPTDALTPYQLDARRCISYLTIELKNEIPEEFIGKYQHWIFGCDICQEVCPWNRFSKPQDDPDFQPDGHLEKMNEKHWEEITDKEFEKFFTKSAVSRTNYKGLKRNITFLNRRK